MLQNAILQCQDVNDAGCLLHSHASCYRHAMQYAHKLSKPLLPDTCTTHCELFGAAEHLS